MADISPLAPAEFPDLPPVAGVRLAANAGNLRYKDRLDLMLAAFAAGTTVAGVFTRSMCPSAPVDWCRRILDRGAAAALVCNAGNANAFTGRAGAASAHLTARLIADALDVEVDDVYLASTGVIGEPLEDDALAAGLAPLAPALAPASAVGWREAADAIRTTDTFPKGAAASVAGGATVVGIAKGSGMIAPDMATMLAFVFTDLALSAETAQHCLSSAVERSFNRITVDSDTSTSDTVLLFATGQSSIAADNPVEREAIWVDAVEDSFQYALDQVCLDLAQQIVRDGEGATKFVTVTTRGAASDHAAALIARSVADSPLVKTALAAEDANWGRIVMAVGKAGQEADRDRLAIWIGDEQVAASGVQLDSYSEERATDHLREPEVSLVVDVGVGRGEATVWTCDLTHGYIEINAGYRT